MYVKFTIATDRSHNRLACRFVALAYMLYVHTHVRAYVRYGRVQVSARLRILLQVPEASRFRDLRKFWDKLPELTTGSGSRADAPATRYRPLVILLRDMSNWRRVKGRLVRKKGIPYSINNIFFHRRFAPCIMHASLAPDARGSLCKNLRDRMFRLFLQTISRDAATSQANAKLLATSKHYRAKAASLRILWNLRILWGSFPRLCKITWRFQTTRAFTVLNLRRRPVAFGILKSAVIPLYPPFHLSIFVPTFI